MRRSTSFKPPRGRAGTPSPAKRGRAGEGAHVAELTTRARELRQRMTEAEKLLWSSLRRRSLGIKFRRQVPVGPFIVDFLCVQARLVIEIDGGQHLGNSSDADRSRWLEKQGYRVLRFWNHDVLKNLEGVVERIAVEIG